MTDNPTTLKEFADKVAAMLKAQKDYFQNAFTESVGFQLLEEKNEREKEVREALSNILPGWKFDD